MPDFMRNCQTVFQYDWTTPISKVLEFQMFQIFGIVSLFFFFGQHNWCKIVPHMDLICFSLVINDVKHRSICLLAFFEKCIFNFYIWLFAFYCCFVEVLYAFWIILFCVICALQVCFPILRLAFPHLIEYIIRIF